MDEILIYIHDLYYAYIGVRRILFIPIIELLLIGFAAILFKTKFRKPIIYILGFGNFIFLFLLVLLSEYIADTKLMHTKITIIDLFDNINIALSIALYFSGLPLVIAIYFYIQNVKSKEVVIPYFIVILSILISFFLWTVLWGLSGDAADCEKLDSNKEKFICENSW